jgi:hypothetical protein
MYFTTPLPADDSKFTGEKIWSQLEEAGECFNVSWVLPVYCFLSVVVRK